MIRAARAPSGRRGTGWRTRTQRVRMGRTMDFQMLPYGISLALLTDLYQLTMAYGYWKSGVADREAVFNLIFRRHPFQGGYTVCAGLANVIDLLEHYRFQEDDLAYLAGLTGSDGKPLFEPAFLDFLGK